jgi:hypothetical protein
MMARSANQHYDVPAAEITHGISRKEGKPLLVALGDQGLCISTNSDICGRYPSLFTSFDGFGVVYGRELYGYQSDWWSCLLEQDRGV